MPVDGTHLPAIMAPAGSALMRCWEPTCKELGGEAVKPYIDRDTESVKGQRVGLSAFLSVLLPHPTSSHLGFLPHPVHTLCTPWASRHS